MLHSHIEKVKFSVRVEGGPGGFYRIAGPALARAIKGSVARDLHNLRALLENRATWPST